MEQLYYKFWAKASNSDGRYHLLPYHNLDVAAVAWSLLSRDENLQQRIGRFLHEDAREKVIPLTTLLLAWHDLGKFSESFQNLRPALLERLLAKESSARYVLRHDSAGWLFFRHQCRKLQRDLFESDSRTLTGCSATEDTLDVIDPLLRAVFGHHGLPPAQRKALSLTSNLFPGVCEQAAHQYVMDTTAFLCPETIRLTSDDTYARDCRAASKGAWLLAGFSVVCDWIGSNSERFKYCSEEMPLREYWDAVAVPTAERAIDELKLLPSKPRPFIGLTSIFPHISEPTPLQRLASTVDMGSEPALFIIEDTTGAGKTEAAIALCHRLMSEHSLESVYFALPTMATANGVFERIKPVFRSLFDENEAPSLVLAHSRRDLSTAFKGLVGQRSVGSSLPVGNEQDEEPGEVGCAAWFADSKKKALLAAFGVGTIDQALVGVLPIKHQSLRLFGASRGVLIIDEVHAFDPYVSKLICTLLEFQGAFGAPVVLLSATLPLGLKEKFSAAYRKGLGAPALSSEQSNPYPSLDIVGKDNARRLSFETRASVRRALKVTYVPDRSRVLSVIQDALTGGKCVCWIRNSIQDALEGFSLVKDAVVALGLPVHDHLRLFHSRFCFGDRQVIEEGVLARFGPASGSSTRTGQALVATQVIEQSLDLDFDVMITDLAPIDLIIQRAGRLMRHARDTNGNRTAGRDERGTPELIVHGPTLEVPPTPSWYMDFSRPSSFVYPHHGQLYLTAVALAQGGIVQVPDDLRTLIEGVYSGDYLERTPEVFHSIELRAEGVDLSKTSVAAINMLKLADGYLESGDEWSSDVDTPTRLSNEQLVVTLVVVENGTLRPLCETAVAWELSEVSIPTGHSELEDSQEAPGIVQVLSEYKAKPEHRWRKFVVVEESGDGCRGRVRKKTSGQIVTFHYSRIFGLELLTNDSV